MKKQKLLLTNNLVSFMRIQGSRDYRLNPTSETLKVFEGLFNNPNAEIVYNYTQASDPRTGKMSKYSPIDIDLSSWFVAQADHAILPKADLTMNSDDLSFCIFNLNTSSRRIYESNVKDKTIPENMNSTFTMNGKIHEIRYTLPETTFYFNNLVFNNTLTKEKREKLPIYLSRYNDVNISGNWIKSLTFNSLVNPVLDISTPDLEKLNITNSASVEIRNLKSKKLDSLVLKNADHVEVNIGRITAPKLKTVDLTGCKKIKLMDSYQFYDLFSSLNGSFINSYRNSVEDKIGEFKKNLVTIARHFDINCKFICSPDAVLEGDFFNPGERRYRYYDDDEPTLRKASEIFKVNSNNQIEFTLPELAKAIYTKQRDNIQSQFKQFDDLLSKDIGKLTKELVEQDDIRRKKEEEEERSRYR